MSKVKWTSDAQLSTATIDLRTASNREGGGECTAFSSRVSTCKRNGLAHERLCYPSFCGRFGLPKLINNVRRSVSYHRRPQLTATIKLTSCLLLLLCCMWMQVSFEVCTKHKVCPVISGRNKKAGTLVVYIDGWTYHEPMQGLLRRVVFPARTWLLESWWFWAWTHDERGRRREMSTQSSLKNEEIELAARNCSIAHHARAPPICRVPSRLVFDSAILFLNSFSEKCCPINPHSLETDLYVRC